MIWLIRADWSTAVELVATPVTPLAPENPEEDEDPENPEDEDPEKPEDDDPVDWALMATNPSCLSVTAENPIGPAS